MKSKENSRTYLHGRQNLKGNFEYEDTFFSLEEAKKLKEKLKKEGKQVRIKSTYKGEADEEHRVYSNALK